MHACQRRCGRRSYCTEETSREVVISLAFDQRGVLDVPLVHGPDPVWSALQSQGHPVW